MPAELRTGQIPPDSC